MIEVTGRNQVIKVKIIKAEPKKWYAYLIGEIVPVLGNAFEYGRHTVYLYNLDGAKFIDINDCEIVERL